ncbi:hypothetical protein Tco_1264851 [Tanacetum coccineum]
MVLQNQPQQGEGSVIPTDPQHTPTILNISTSQPQKTQTPREFKIMDTEIPQSSSPMEHVADEFVHKERGDSLVRAATTTSSLEAEQDSGNITKTRSKATLNEPSSLGTSSGSGPRRQETMGDIIAQTRFENVSKLFNDPLLARGNTLQSGEDSLKLNELMELCTNLQQWVLDLETTKTTQANEIAILKRRVKKLEKKDRDEEDLGEDASKQGRRIHDTDADEDITLVNDDNEIFDVDALASEEVFVAEQSENVVKEVVDAAQTITTEEITLAKALADLKSIKFKVNGLFSESLAKVKADYQLAQRLQAQEQEELTNEEKARLFVQFLEQRRKHFAAKRAEEKRNIPPTRAQQRNIITELVEESSKKAETELEENLKKAEAEVMEGSSKRAGEELEQESIKKQKVDEDKEIAELQSLMEFIPDEEEVAINVVPLATKPPSIVDWKIHKEGKKSYYQIIRADGKSQMYRVFSQMLKSFSREYLEDLYKLVKAKYGSTRPVENLDLILYGDLKIMFKPHVEDQVWKNQDDYNVLDWKLYDSCGVHSLRMQHVYIHIWVEKRYPLTPYTTTDMLNKKLQDDYLNEMAYQIFKLLTKQLKNQ